MDNVLDFQPVYPRHDLMIEIGKVQMAIEHLAARKLAFVGSPSTVIEQIKAAAEEGVFNTVLGEFNFGAMLEEDVMRSIKLFASEVMPALRGFQPY